MQGTVGVTCDCGTDIVVLPTEVYSFVGAAAGGVEAELAYRQQLAAGKAALGTSLAIADADRVFTCPECGAVERLPPADELWVDAYPFP